MRRAPSTTLGRRLFAAAWFGAGCALLAGCTLLVDFVSKDLPGDGTDDGTFRPDVHVTDAPVADAPLADGPAPEAAPDASTRDVRVDAAQCPNPCKNRDNGWYCGTDGLYCLAPADDLYHCIADAAADVLNCGAGSGCIQLPPGHPDTCDPCPGKADGTYCGKDLATIVPHEPGRDKNDIYLFACQGGHITLASKACVTDCGGTPPNAKCL